MPKSDENEDWIEKMEDLCSNLNVDSSAAKKSKDSFSEIKRNYILDVSKTIIAPLYCAFNEALSKKFNLKHLIARSSATVPVLYLGEY